MRHQLIAFTPPAILLIPAMTAERWNYHAGSTIALVSIVLYGVMIIWIILRKMAGLGFCSSARSDRVAKRQQRKRAQLSTAADHQ
jgi:hypothetical protein